MEHGTRVRLKREPFRSGRPHLRVHARDGDIGVVAPPSEHSPGMAQLYIIVHFDRCGRDHRLLESELERV